MKGISTDLRLVAVAFLALCWSAGITQAAPTQAQQDAIRSSCQSDYRAHCASVPPGGSAALQCLEKNAASLSTACQQAVSAATGSSASSPTTTAPADATAAAPPATAPAKSPAAPAPIVLQPRQEIMLMRQACGPDYRSHCAGVGLGGGGAVGCLVSHAASLSSACRSALSGLGQRF